MANYIIKFKNGQKQIWHIVSVEELIPDAKDNLRVQLRQFVDEIEDAEQDRTSLASIELIKFLDDCYRAA